MGDILVTANRLGFAGKWLEALAMMVGIW